MALVGKERIAVLAQTQHIHAHHVETRDDERREREHHGVDVDMVSNRMCGEELDTHYREYETDGERTGVTHENLTVLLHVAEHIVIEKRHEDTESGKRDAGKSIFTYYQERHAVDYRSYRAQARGQTVNTVDKIDGVDEEHYHESSERHSQPRRYVINAEDSTDGVKPRTAAYQHCGTDDLHHEFGYIADTDEGIGNTHKVKKLKSAE